MFHHCIYCVADLGANEAVEHFPVGTRLAFDGEKGRLWAVCRRCRRWNLTPLETRWEALEECERLFRGTRLRYSTDQIGLARLPGGAELVRIGRPPRPELAAWRYGRVFGRRRRRAAIHGSIATVLGGTILIGPLFGAAAVGAVIAATTLGQVYALAWQWRSVQRIPGDEGEHYALGHNERWHIRLIGSGDDWGIELPYLFMEAPGAERRRMRELLNLPAMGTVRLRGQTAIHAAGLVLPRVNGAGAGEGRVEAALRFLDETVSAESAFAYAAANTRKWSAEQLWGDTGSLRFLPAPVRLGLEMISHEDQERRALDGELRVLEQDWKEAEEVAAIADDLLVPDGVRQALARLRAGTGPASRTPKA